MHSQALLSTMHVQKFTLHRCCEHQLTHLLHACYRMCIWDRYRERDIHMCIFIYIYVYVYVYAFIYVYVSMYICMCMYMYMYLYIYLCMYSCICVHVYIYMCMFIHKFIIIFEESQHAFTGVVKHHACAGVYVRQMLWTSAYTFASRSLQNVHMRYIYTCIYAYVCIYIRMKIAFITARKEIIQ